MYMKRFFFSITLVFCARACPFGSFRCRKETTVFIAVTTSDSHQFIEPREVLDSKRDPVANPIFPFTRGKLKPAKTGQHVPSPILWLRRLSIIVACSYQITDMVLSGSHQAPVLQFKFLDFWIAVLGNLVKDHRYAHLSCIHL